jgi:hypothetical protein
MYLLVDDKRPEKGKRRIQDRVLGPIELPAPGDGPENGPQRAKNELPPSDNKLPTALISKG